MAAKLFTIGDSISQGFMSGAAAATELCYSTILATAIDVKDYRYLHWEKDYKTKVDLEAILRQIESKFGTNIRGLEWLGILPTINEILDKAEDYFERGDGRLGQPVTLTQAKLGFHNVSVEGMDVADAFQVTPNLCKEYVNNVTKKQTKDNYLKGPSAPFYRNAYRILNPLGEAGENTFGDFSPVDCLASIAKNEGVENVCLMLGANNALGTIIDLEIKQTPNNPEQVLNATREQRQKWNLWHPNDFQREYEELLDRVIQAMESNQESDWKVFIGNVPLVTIAPLAKGIGNKRIIKDPAGSENQCLYYQYYTFFPLSEKNALSSGKYLTFRDALFIDKTIIKFNKIIQDLVNQKNQQLGKEHFHIVDICQSLTEMAYKRNNANPNYQFPEYFDYLYPPVDTKYYHASRKGKIEAGGIFSLDGIHPSAIGQGLIAWEFLKVMQKKRPELSHFNIDWPTVFSKDSLRNNPIKIMNEIYEHDKFISFFSNVSSLIRTKD